MVKGVAPSSVEDIFFNFISYLCVCVTPYLLLRTTASGKKKTCFSLLSILSFDVYNDDSLATTALITCTVLMLYPLGLKKFIIHLLVLLTKHIGKAGKVVLTKAVTCVC